MGAIFYIINMAEQNNVEFVIRRKSCLLFFYIFLFIFRLTGQMHAELFEDALIYRGKPIPKLCAATTAFWAAIAVSVTASIRSPTPGFLGLQPASR